MRSNNKRSCNPGLNFKHSPEMLLMFILVKFLDQVIEVASDDNEAPSELPSRKRGTAARKQVGKTKNLKGSKQQAAPGLNFKHSPEMLLIFILVIFLDEVIEVASNDNEAPSELPLGRRTAARKQVDKTKNLKGSKQQAAPGLNFKHSPVMLLIFILVIFLDEVSEVASDDNEAPSELTRGIAVQQQSKKRGRPPGLNL